MPPGYAPPVEAAGNYHSGDDYVVEFLGYRFSFSASTSRSGSPQRRSGSASSPIPSWTRTRRPTSSSSSSGTPSRAPQRSRRIPRPALGRARARPRRVARLLAEEARLPRRVARPPREGGPARGRLGRRAAGLHLRRHERRPRAARAPPHAELARAPVPPVTVPRCVRGRAPAYLAALLAVDTQVGHGVQVALGVLTFAVLAAALRTARAARARAGARRRRCSRRSAR